MKRFIVVVFSLFLVLSLYSQNLEVQVPKLVSVGEQFSILFVTSEKYEDFTPPDLSGFNIMAGPVYSNRTYTSGGQSSVIFTVIYYVSAKAEGKITIGKAEAKINGKAVSSSPVVVDVVKASGGTNKGQQASQSGQTAPSTIGAKDLYARVELSNTSVFQGESLIATLKVYTRVSIIGSSNFKLPVFTGFHSQEIEVPRNEEILHRENVNGEIYNAAVLKRYVLTPQQLGALVIPPLEMTLIVETAKARNSSTDPFDLMFDSPFDQVNKKVISPSVSVTVKGLPSGAPTTFNGAVGNFKIESTIDKTQIQANQALAYSLNISGTGNLKLIEQPKIIIPPDFDKYDPKVTENIKTTILGSSGSKSYEFALIPRSAGNFTIPGVEFSFFDPSKGSYTSLKSKDINIKVEKDPTGGGGAVTTVVPGINQQNIRHLGQDIVFIKTTPLKVSTKGSIFFTSLSYWLLISLLLIVFVIIFLLFKKRIKESRNLALMKNKTANKVAHKRLKTSSKLLKDGNTQGFYEEVLRAMWGYAGNKLNIPIANLSRDNAQETLQTRNVQQVDIDTFLNVIDECEFARYAPGTERSAMEHVFNNAITVISKFEQTIR